MWYCRNFFLTSPPFWNNITNLEFFDVFLFNNYHFLFLVCIIRFTYFLVKAVSSTSSHISLSSIWSQNIQIKSSIPITHIHKRPTFWITCSKYFHSIIDSKFMFKGFQLSSFRSYFYPSYIYLSFFFCLHVVYLFTVNLKNNLTLSTQICEWYFYFLVHLWFVSTHLLMVLLEYVQKSWSDCLQTLHKYVLVQWPKVSLCHTSTIIQCDTMIL